MCGPLSVGAPMCLVCPAGSTVMLHCNVCFVFMNKINGDGGLSRFTHNVLMNCGSSKRAPSCSCYCSGSGSSSSSSS